MASEHKCELDIQELGQLLIYWEPKMFSYCIPVELSVMF